MHREARLVRFLTVSPTAVARAARDPAYRAQAATLYNEPVSSTPDEFRAFVNAEMAKYAALVRRSGMKVE